MNCSDNWGVTPMYLAASSGLLLVVHFLIVAGAKLTYRNKVGCVWIVHLPGKHWNSTALPQYYKIVTNFIYDSFIFALSKPRPMPYLHVSEFILCL